ncbi:conserved hypothetical protein [Carnobacterium maltaromaticum]|nr:conserved hypothetical protein [Carnobacterium maltaromaticum]
MGIKLSFTRMGKLNKKVEFQEKSKKDLIRVFFDKKIKKVKNRKKSIFLFYKSFISGSKM